MTNFIAKEKDLKKIESAKSKFDVNYKNNTLVTRHFAINIQVRVMRK